MILTFDAWGRSLLLAPETLAASLVAVLGYGLAAQKAYSEGTQNNTGQASHANPGAVQWPRVGLWLGWALHGLAILLELGWLGSALPRFGFALALSMTAWLVLAVYGFESRFFPLLGVRRALALCAMCGVGLALFFPGQGLAQMTPWAPLHWMLGIAAYGLFGAAILHAILLNQAEKRMRQKALPTRTFGLPLLQLERLTFWFIQWGFVVLTAALLLGWWLAPFWRWDHKAVFSLGSWALFLGLLAGRSLFGWRGVQLTRWLYVGVALLVLAYVGSRFVFEVFLQGR